VSAQTRPSGVWAVGDECVVKDPTRVWRIVGWLDKWQTIADLAPVGFVFNGKHSAHAMHLRDVPTSATKENTP
jgi:hypothetical protein